MNNSFRFFLNEEAKKAGIVFRPPRELDAGFDISCLHEVRILPKQLMLISTGLHIALPEKTVGFVKDRSSVASRGGTTLAGVIDAGYRGEVKVLMCNLGDNELVFKSGERIAQCVILQYAAHCECIEAFSLEELGDTQRGSGGFGSTGQ